MGVLCGSVAMTMQYNFRYDSTNMAALHRDPILSVQSSTIIWACRQSTVNMFKLYKHYSKCRDTCHLPRHAAFEIADCTHR